jgi:hypothetical protein
LQYQQPTTFDFKIIGSVTPIGGLLNYCLFLLLASIFDKKITKSSELESGNIISTFWSIKSVSYTKRTIIRVPQSIPVNDLGIENVNIHYKLSPEELHDSHTIKTGQGIENSTGALAVNREYTGRRLKIVLLCVIASVSTVKVNIPFEPAALKTIQ